MAHGFTHTQTCRDRCPPALPSLVEVILDLVADTALDAESGQLLRIVSGKDLRTVDEMFRDSKRARETGQYWWYQGANEVRTSTPRSRRPKPRQEEQAPMECNELEFVAVFCQKFAVSLKEVGR